MGVNFRSLLNNLKKPKAGALIGGAVGAGLGAATTPKNEEGKREGMFSRAVLGGGLGAATGYSASTIAKNISDNKIILPKNSPTMKGSDQTLKNVKNFRKYFGYDKNESWKIKSKLPLKVRVPGVKKMANVGTILGASLGAGAGAGIGYDNTKRYKEKLKKAYQMYGVDIEGHPEFKKLINKKKAANMIGLGAMGAILGGGLGYLSNKYKITKKR